MTIGPILILTLVGVFWLDGWLEGMPVPRALSWLLGQTGMPPGTILFFFGLGLSLLGAWELAGMLRRNGITASSRITCLAAASGFSVWLVRTPLGGLPSVAIVGSVATGVLLVALVFYSRHKSFEGVVAAAGGTTLAFVYLGLTFGFLFAIRREHSLWILLWILAATKSCDIGAYFTGRAIGKRKLIPWLSPKKTWEGLMGGVVLAAGVGAFGAWLLAREGIESFSPVQGGVAGALFAVVGQLGDLIASLFKRDAGLKDSGKVLPGFGGVLDVIDSPVLVGPAAYWWLTLIV